MSGGRGQMLLARNPSYVSRMGCDVLVKRRSNVLREGSSAVIAGESPVAPLGSSAYQRRLPGAYD
jgi:hypothetical protein